MSSKIGTSAALGLTDEVLALLRLAPAIVAISDGARAKARTALLDRSGRSGPLATVVVAVLIAPACVAALVIALAGGFLSGGGFEVAALGTRHL